MPRHLTKSQITASIAERVGLTKTQSTQAFEALVALTCKQGWRAKLGIVALALIIFYPAIGCSNGRGGMLWQNWPGMPSRSQPLWWAQVDFTKPHNIPWSNGDFAALAQDGMNGVEINLDWGNIEPRENRYDFQLLDRYMAEAAKSHLKIYLLFWESVWGGPGKNPPAWITARDLSSDGVKALEPPWWDPTSRKAYFDYVARTIDHVKRSPGFGGVYAAYGWLDSEWGPAPRGSHGVTGYAPADVQAFYRWLPQTYKTVARFNRRWHTSYRAWSAVPVGRPGEPLFPLYQRFRQYSAEEGFAAISRLVREHTQATLLYSWGGGICGRIGPEVQGNDPDMFFRLARKYHAIVNLDDCDTTGLALLFGSMARYYGVPLLNEWTPGRPDLRPEAPQWLGHIGLDAPYEVGEDFFIYPPSREHLGFVQGWQVYQQFHRILTKVIQGVMPWQPVAAIVPLRQISLSGNLNADPNLARELGDFWRHYHVLPQFVSDEQVERGIVSLRRFRAVVDLGDEAGTLPALKAYAKKHPILKTLEQTVAYLQPYETLKPQDDSIEVVPTVEGSEVWLTLANCSGQAYNGSVRFHPMAIGLRAAAASIVKDAETGGRVAALRRPNGDMEWPVHIAPAGFQVLELRPFAPAQGAR